MSKIIEITKRLASVRRKRRKNKSSPDPIKYKVGNSEVNIGRFTYGRENLKILQFGEGANLSIGSFCSIAKGVTINLGGNHRADWITTYPFGHVFTEEFGNWKPIGHPATKGDVKIGHDVWIASGVTILSGICIGSGAVIAANSTLTKDVKPYEIWGGNPARRIGCRFDDDTVSELLSLQWWALPKEKILEIISDLSSCPDPQSIERIRKKITDPKY